MRSNNRLWHKWACGQSLPTWCAIHLEDLLSNATKLSCLSMVLHGSWVYGVPTPSSDLDVLFVFSNDEDKYKMELFLRNVSPKLHLGAPSLDAKVTTMGRLQEAWRGLQHLAVHTIANRGITLTGTCFSNRFPLVPKFLNRVLTTQLYHAESALALLEAHREFSVAAVSLVDVFKTFLFVERHVLRIDDTHSTETRMRVAFGEAFGSVQRLWTGIKRKTATYGLDTSIRLDRIRNDDHSTREYRTLFMAGESIMRYAETTYRTVRRLLE